MSDGKWVKHTNKRGKSKQPAKKDGKDGKKAPKNTVPTLEQTIITKVSQKSINKEPEQKKVEKKAPEVKKGVKTKPKKSAEGKMTMDLTLKSLREIEKTESDEAKLFRISDMFISHFGTMKSQSIEKLTGKPFSTRISYPMSIFHDKEIINAVCDFVRIRVSDEAAIKYIAMLFKSVLNGRMSGEKIYPHELCIQVLIQAKGIERFQDVLMDFKMEISNRYMRKYDLLKSDNDDDIMEKTSEANLNKDIPGMLFIWICAQCLISPFSLSQGSNVFVLYVLPFLNISSYSITLEVLNFGEEAIKVSAGNPLDVESFKYLMWFYGRARGSSNSQNPRMLRFTQIYTELKKQCLVRDDSRLYLPALLDLADQPDIWIRKEVLRDVVGIFNKGGEDCVRLWKNAIVQDRQGYKHRGTRELLLGLNLGWKTLNSKGREIACQASQEIGDLMNELIQEDNKKSKGKRMEKLIKLELFKNERRAFELQKRNDYVINIIIMTFQLSVVLFLAILYFVCRLGGFSDPICQIFTFFNRFH